MTLGIAKPCPVSQKPRPDIPFHPTCVFVLLSFQPCYNKRIIEPSAEPLECRQRFLPVPLVRCQNHDRKTDEKLLRPVCRPVQRINRPRQMSETSQSGAARAALEVWRRLSHIVYVHDLPSCQLHLGTADIWPTCIGSYQFRGLGVHLCDCGPKSRYL